MTRREAITNAAVLAGIGLSIPTLSVCLSSCHSEPSEHFDILSIDQATTLRNLAQLILPKGKNLGAEDVNLANLTDILLRDCEEPKTKAEMLLTLDFLKNQDMNSDGFVEKLKSIETEAFGSEEPSPDVLGYKKLKSYILFAFFTSENVLETMLDYNPVPTKYEGCIPVTDDTKVYEDLNV